MGGARRGLACLVAALTALSASVAGAGVMVAASGDPVTIDTGRVAGTLKDDGVRSYLGIPFAAPPLRENRWREPQPVAPWNGVYNADSTKPECVQGLRSASINNYFGDEVAGEDCLYLNLWTPAGASPGSKLPVVVYIYGGGFTIGSASMPVYAGDSLARKGVVYVAANYRVGTFGFLAHPELTAESGRNASGNWGMLDQIAALKWIQRNIAAFGGDPANVTLVGQSAGSMAISMLQASPLSRGLFQRVFGMSGAAVGGGPADASVALSDSEAQGIKLQQALDVKNIAEMRMVSSDKVEAAALRARVQARPNVDGYFLPRSARQIFEAGEQNDVAVVTGWTANDIGATTPLLSAKTVAEYRDIAMKTYGARSADFLKVWPASNDAAAIAQAKQVARNSGFGLAGRNWARLQAATGKQPSYLYLHSRVHPFTPGVTYTDFDPATAGAYHMGEVPYFLGTLDSFNLYRQRRDWTALDRALSNQMQDVIVSYARTGDPRTPAVKFVRYDPKNEQRVVFGDTITVERINTPGIDFIFNSPPSAPPAPAAPTPTRPMY